VLKPASPHAGKIEIFFHEPKAMLASRHKEDIMETRWAEKSPRYPRACRQPRHWVLLMAKKSGVVDMRVR
jgi:hypothetical protein